MANPSPTWRGVVRGKTIELEQDPGLPDGQEVWVTVRPVSPAEKDLPPGEGLRRSFGGWSDDAEELEPYLDYVRQQRKVARPPIEP